MKATFLAGASALALLVAVPSVASASFLDVEVKDNQIAGESAANHGSVAGDAIADEGNAVDASGSPTTRPTI